VTNPARDKALTYLGRFARTERQVKVYLQKKGFAADEIKDAILFLREHRFLNDTSYAESFIQSKIHHGDGPLKIKQMLFQKGVDSNTSNELLNSMYPQELQLEKAVELLQKRRSATREKQIRFIASRGFPRYVIIQALKKSQ